MSDQITVTAKYQTQHSNQPSTFNVCWLVPPPKGSLAFLTTRSCVPLAWCSVSDAWLHTLLALEVSHVV